MPSKSYLCFLWHSFNVTPFFVDDRNFQLLIRNVQLIFRFHGKLKTLLYKTFIKRCFTLSFVISSHSPNIAKKLFVLSQRWQKSYSYSPNVGKNVIRPNIAKTLFVLSQHCKKVIRTLPTLAKKLFVPTLPKSYSYSPNVAKKLFVLSQRWEKSQIPNGFQRLVLNVFFFDK